MARTCGARKKPFGQISIMEEECLIERRRTVTLKECSEIVNSNIRYNKDGFRRLLQDENFMDKLFVLFDHDQDGLLIQDEWIEFLKERLTTEKQIDFAEQLESVAYVLCGEEAVTAFTFRQILRAKGVVDKIFRFLDLESAGYVTAGQIMEFVGSITSIRSRAGFDKESLAHLENIFKQTVGNEKEIRREEFKKIVVSKNPFFTERVFQIFDKDNSGTISLQEFLDSMHQFAGKTPDDKIKFLFKVYDIDGDGLIQHRELQHVMRVCMEENGMTFSEDQIEDLTIALFEDADQENRGAITFESLKSVLEKHDGLLENLSISIDRWLVPPKPEPKQQSSVRRLSALRPYQLTKPYMKNNYVYIIFTSAFLIVNAGLFVSRAIQYKSSNGFVILARACGQCLNFNCAFILILMLRHSITFLRTHGFSSVIPLDQHIYLHKTTGVLVGFYSIIHTIMHLFNFKLIVVNDYEINKGNYTYAEWIFTGQPKLFGLVPGAANPTGVALVLILTVMIICSMPFVRRGGCFEIFYWTHLLYVPFWILLIFHGPNFWKWFVGPCTLYLVERLRRVVWLQSQRGNTYICSGLLLPSRVTHLVIKRPNHFDFHPGDYVFVNIPAVAKYEWHPFTISSAPEQEDYMWLHIRGVGEWTNTLYSYFDREQMKLHRGEVLPVECCTQRTSGAIKTVEKLPSNSEVTLCRTIKTTVTTGSAEETNGVANPSFEGDDGCSHPGINKTRVSGRDPRHLSKKVALNVQLHKIVLSNKHPLEKSISMPDMRIRNKKRERLLALRDYARSESEPSFDESQIRRARLKSLGLAYLSPQNKSLAQSFRYMRMKPTIIAFKTPSLDNCGADDIVATIDSETEESDTRSPPLIAAEEGTANVFHIQSVEESTKGKSQSFHTPVNYPVGKPLAIYLDGPYGAPSSHIFQAQHAVLIATGIGVTPFASILQSIMHRYWKARHCCPKCKFSWASEIPPTVMHLRKVDFFWINRDQHSFEWFVNLLSQLEMEQAELGATMERFLEMHMYITSALQKNDMKAVGLQLAMDLLHEKEKRDLITGLKTRTNAGRPNWDKVFKQLQDQKKGKITVFFCGPLQLARILRYKCDQFGFNFRKEVF
ncbi:NADPH oxidase 5 isoform X1 [Neodiprion fabricii]|uniref:NADPH oxidase 5 isoform X1 n=1 Tax=Neodiprion fabricii TaxID=2872261 RepID=UPI001ED8E37E|nr:NADPH oxidase 5 isoform X1 [Neodiprion fabricii]